MATKTTSPVSPTSNADMQTDSTAQQNLLQGKQQVQPATTQQDINSILTPYVNEMMQLGPEYSEEMEFLKPYLEGTGSEAPETFQQVEQNSAAQESPTGNTAVNEADQSAGSALENEPAPGFGALGKAGQEYESTLPYSDILQTVLGAGKNEILYGTTPNVSAISTEGWPSSLQSAYSYLTQNATGENAATGLTSPASAAQQANQEAAQNAGGVFATGSNVSGGGNAS